MSDRNPLRQAVTRRRFVQLAGAGVGAASLTGLVTTRRFASALAQDAAGGELIVGATADSYRTEPNRATIGMYAVNTNIFESLVRLTPDYQIEPMLAESWEFVEPNTFRFKLRQGVTFHDGTPFTAEAVRWSMNRIALAGGGSIGVDENSTKVIDDFTVEITPTRPNHQLVQQLNHPVNSIVAPNSEPAEVRIGTGPFKEVEYAKEDRYVVEAYDGYWGDKPKLSRITFRFMPDATTRLLALQSGEVDLIYEVPKESAQQIETLGDFSLGTSKVGAYEALYVNIHGKPPYDLGQDRAIREALAYAIHKDAIVSGVWQGNAEPSKTMIPPAILGPAGDTIQGTTFDPDRAKQLLEAAGWVPGEGGIRAKDGRPLKLTMIVGFPNAEVHKPMPEFVQAQLKDIGIELELVQTPDTATYEARLTTGEGDLWAEAGSQNDGNPCFLPDLLFYSPDPEADPESAMYGNAFAPGPAFDAFIDQCRSATSIEAVQEAAAGAMKVLIDQEFVVIPLAGTFRLFGLGPNVEGFEAHPSGVNQRWTSVSVTG
ncbi:MAG: ABC transporter substrate-binding protein [Chloroflexota bacterium]|nr:ABC transporter substrate-binding protein [Chloroflexota bacterium]